MLARRDLLLGGLGGVLAGALAASPIGLRAAFADVPGENRFVFIVLRGAMDGLSVVVPYGDPDYRRLRQDLALNPPGATDGVTDLDGFFGLHPRLVTLGQWYQERAFLPVQAVATPYRERSHFDGQDLLETGGTTPHGLADGWLNRCLAALGGQKRLGLAVGDQIPLVIRGRIEVASWAPSNLPPADGSFMSLVEAMYRHEPQLAATLAEAVAATNLASQAQVTGSEAGSDAQMGNQAAQPGKGNAAQLALFSAAGKMLADPQGPRIAVLEVGGWDTHSGQGTVDGRLGRNLQQLDLSLATLRAGLGAAWTQTVILAATEFGRTAAPNGTGGTDHGTAAAALLMGGAVAGGKVLVDWPGLANAKLFQARDLAPTLDLRSVVKGVLASHLALPEARLATEVFPGSQGIAPASGLTLKS
jgi:uncharacterized protein (DUF1501 family)